MFTEKEKNDALNEAYKNLGHNAYFGNGFEAGVKFALEKAEIRIKELEEAARILFLIADEEEVLQYEEDGIDLYEIIQPKTTN